MIEDEVELHRFSFPLNADGERIADITARGNQIREFNLAVERIDVVSVLIDLVVPDRHDNISDLQSGFRRRRVRLDARHVNAGGLARLSRETPELRIARREKTEAGGGETAVVLRFRVFQEMRDDGRGDCIEDLRPRIETQEQTGQLIVFDQRNRVAVLAILHRNAYAVG